MARHASTPPLKARVGICLSTSQRQWLQDQVQTSGAPISEVVRRLIEREAQRSVGSSEPTDEAA